ncbi:MAG: hypothetical protein CME61_07960 [Halobacteriovoraceae bacterium]|nr:hypothetical protein [Halobacteriovoraceae bacterium]
MKAFRKTCEEGFPQYADLFQRDSAIESTLALKVTLGLAPRRNPLRQVPQGLLVSYRRSRSRYLLAGINNGTGVEPNRRGHLENSISCTKTGFTAQAKVLTCT